MEIIGRKEEQALFSGYLRQKDPVLLAIYGRRRVGKTCLVNEFFGDKGVFFALTGVRDAKTAAQLHNFNVEFSKTFRGGTVTAEPTGWSEAFERLNDAASQIPKSKKLILFFDELPWLATQKSGFLEALDYLWNRHLSRRDNVIAIVCGSAASWMIDHVINDKGGLYDRVTRQIRLLPFTLAETRDYLGSRDIHYDLKQIIEVYMALGGVPQYLSYLERGLSAAQNIQNICFSDNAPLFSEFPMLFRSLFDKSGRHEAVVRALGKRGAGLPYREVVGIRGLSSGGTASKTLDELVQSGFVGCMNTFGKGGKASRYQLIDEYSLFHLKWLRDLPPIAPRVADANHWVHKYRSAAWHAWAGFAFEKIVRKHIRNILHALGISGVSTEISGWSWTPPRGSPQKGAQIDLVIDRADRCINLCEIKFHAGECDCSKTDADDVKRKKSLFIRETGTRKTVFTTLITTFGALENRHYLNAVDNQLRMDVLF